MENPACKICRDLAALERSIRLQRHQLLADLAPVIIPQIEAEMKERKKRKKRKRGDK